MLIPAKGNIELFIRREGSCWISEGPVIGWRYVDGFVPLCPTTRPARGHEWAVVDHDLGIVKRPEDLSRRFTVQWVDGVRQLEIHT